MSGPEFFQTYMGKRFYEVTMPALSRNVEKLADGIGKLVALQEAAAGAKTQPATAPTRKIMIFTATDGEGGQFAILTPEGMDEPEAQGLAEEVLAGLEARDEAEQDNDDYDEWQVEDLIRALEVRGFLSLETITGPCWDRKG